ncbi:MAG: redoxin [Burkholderiales bacterium PBB4]|nr:MAG: redoxin [Burkholderiales bacterium PBB4]
MGYRAPVEPVVPPTQPHTCTMKNFKFPIALLGAALLGSMPAVQAEPAAVKQPLTVVATTLEGGKFDPASLKGKVVMVYYWSTSCAVCRSHLSELRANLAGWKSKPFALVTVNVDADAAQWRAYEHIASQTQAVRPVSLWEPKGASGKLPITLVTDVSGAVKYRYEGRIAPESWDMVAELLP